MVSEKIKPHIEVIVFLALVGKLVLAGLTMADGFGALVILASLHVEYVVHYIFPRRPDLFKEVSDIKEEMKKIEGLQSDVTALKITAGVGRR